MNDHDLLIQLITNTDNLCEKVDKIDKHVSVMNSEQGSQAIKMAEMNAQVSLMFWITLAISGAVIGQLIMLIFNKIKNGNGK
jgi:hypothetical protein